MHHKFEGQCECSECKEFNALFDSKEPAEIKNQNKDIKAQAVMSVIDNVKSFSAFGSSKMISVDDIIKYANTLKESEWQQVAG